jgi:hypothetical protein
MNLSEQPVWDLALEYLWVLMLSSSLQYYLVRVLLVFGLVGREISKLTSTQ